MCFDIFKLCFFRCKKYVMSDEEKEFLRQQRCKFYTGNENHIDKRIKERRFEEDLMEKKHRDLEMHYGLSSENPEIRLRSLKNKKLD